MTAFHPIKIEIPRIKKVTYPNNLPDSYFAICLIKINLFNLIEGNPNKFKIII